MKIILFIAILFSFDACLLNKSYSQDVVDDIGSSIELGDSGEIFTETIRIIARSRRVFILTNSNQMLNKGDFITLILNEKDPVARALVGKDHQGRAGIKILKIYSLTRWSLLKRGLDIKILKGDDSVLFKKVEEKPKDEIVEKIETEEDLYDISMVDKELNMFGKDNRLIKPDNIVSGGYSRYTLENDISGDTEVYNQYHGAWSYQFVDNFWLEGLYGRILMSNVPATGTQTLINNITLRLKYTFQAPLYSYLMPYVGFKMHSVSSPDAGNVSNSAQAEAELELIEKMQDNALVAGVTILRRLVPGWFIKADLGTDQLNIGFAIEF
jgi:hypothetical protein